MPSIGLLRGMTAVATLTLLPAATAFAQCPDGTPPPCRSQAAASPARRPNPPLDDRTWVVLPFENIARVADIAWLSDASVNLLYLDMSKWRDIHVIDDERVADLIREVPEARGGVQLTLQSGIAVARRAGAGKLVMGDLLKVGNRTRVVAKVYDVRTGQRMRSVEQIASTPDSLVSVFGRLARAILNADPPAGTSLGSIGTVSLEAYRNYVSGVTALNRVDLDSAAAAFNRAIALDSTFALAHYKASVVYGWINAGDRRRVAHAEAANRLSAGLPPRERQLILGQQQTSNGRWGEACLTYGALLRADSSDVDAWYNLGECSYHDQAVVALSGDASRYHFRGSWNTALRAFQKALELDPTYHLAYSHIPDILLVEQRIGCRDRDVMDDCDGEHQYLSRVLRAGDSLVTTPANVNDLNALSRQSDEAARLGVWRTNLQQNRASAQAWVNSGPDEPRAHLALARALLRSGQPAEAAREFALARPAQLGTAETGRTTIDRLELLFKLDSMAGVARMVDSIAAVPASAAGLSQSGFAAILLGRWSRMDALLGPNFQGPPQMRRFLVAAMQTIQGAPPADLITIELAMDSLPGGLPAAVRAVFHLATVSWTMSLDRPAALRVTDTSATEPRTRLVEAALRRDTAAVRAALVRLDSIGAVSPRELPTTITFQLAAEGYLWLGDTASALARLREVEDRRLFQNPMSTYMPTFGNLTVVMQTWGRTFMRLGDLASARGDRVTAQRNYRRVVDLWSGADAAFQPMVQRARAGLQ